MMFRKATNLVGLVLGIEHLVSAPQHHFFVHEEMIQESQSSSFGTTAHNFSPPPVFFRFASSRLVFNNNS